jgi:hypothetical protein
MAEQANRVDLGSIQHVWIRSSMRNVAGHAALGLDHCVFVDKKPDGFIVALRADKVLLRRSSWMLFSGGTVWLMAIGTRNQTLVHFVAGGHGERSSLIVVTSKARFRLRRLDWLFHRGLCNC